jgi:hypothetical protein
MTGSVRFRKTFSPESSRRAKSFVDAQCGRLSVSFRYDLLKHLTFGFVISGKWKKRNFFRLILCFQVIDSYTATTQTPPELR